MKHQSVREQAAISVAKMALDLSEQSGKDVLEMVKAVDSASLPPGSLPGSIIDISV
jgi:hypothetical protein